VIQGFGNVGSWAAKIIHAAGIKVIAVSSVDGGTYNRDGVDIIELDQYQRESGGVSGFSGGDDISNTDLLELECDVLIPAAIDNVINSDNAANIKAQLVLEAANHPTTPEADRILAERAIEVLPDILVNAGGVIVSYFEWTQNLQEFRWEEQRVNSELHRIITNAYREVQQRTVNERITARHAAFEIGMQRVARVVELRGFV
jgi:glutamate dehydrogenase (NAD(P)+)